MNISEIKWVPGIYPREKWNTATVERYADAMIAGDEFPPVTIEKETKALLDGKHRLEAYKKAAEIAKASEEPDDRTFDDIPVTAVSVPDGMSLVYFAATLSSRHGFRMSNADLKALALAEFDPSLHEGDDAWEMPDAQEWGRGLGLSKSTVYEWVSHFLNRARATRATKAVRLAALGWTHAEIAEVLGVGRSTITEDVENSEIGKIDKSLGEKWNDRDVAEFSNRTAIPRTDALAAAMAGMEETERLKKLKIKIQPYDVWNFSSCHDLMGDQHPGRIPGELICHALYFMTKPGDLVVDPMVGSGTTLDACLLMGRKARGYDIDGRHDRVDIEKHNLSDGWPDKVAKADLVFWDPPYFDKMDKKTIGDEGYVDGSISGLSPKEYLQWLARKFGVLHDKTGDKVKLAFLMSDWDSENAKQHKGMDGIHLWDYADALRKAGWKIKRQIQCPLPTQQVHPDIVIKFRESRRMARLGRYLLECEK